MTDFLSCFKNEFSEKKNRFYYRPSGFFWQVRLLFARGWIILWKESNE